MSDKCIHCNNENDMAPKGLLCLLCTVKFKSKIDPETNCLIWPGKYKKNPAIIYKGKYQHLHQVLFNKINNPSHIKSHIRRTCKNSICISVDHMYTHSKEEMETLYLKEGWSVAEIAKKFNISPQATNTIMRKNISNEKILQFSKSSEKSKEKLGELFYDSIQHSIKYGEKYLTKLAEDKRFFTKINTKSKNKYKYEIKSLDDLKKQKELIRFLRRYLKSLTTIKTKIQYFKQQD